MTRFESFSVSFSGNTFIILLLIILFILFSFFIYRYTLPAVSVPLKLFLTSIRAAIFILILLLIFELIFSLRAVHTTETKTFLFIDNSNSIAAKDSNKRLEQINFFLDDLNTYSNFKVKPFLFANQIDSMEESDPGKIKLSGEQTNFFNVIEFIKKREAQINSAIIFSDGIITDGIDPSYLAEKLQLPLFTVGIGDSLENRDVEILNLFFNQFIYAERQTTIEATIKNIGFGNKTTRVSFYEEDNLVSSNEITLNEYGINKVLFDYIPASGGEKKLSIIISPLNGEAATANNRSVFFINVLETKLKICLIAGSPSADLSAISKALSADKNIDIKKLIQISPGKFWNNVKIDILDSADVFFMIDFPFQNTPQNLIDKISSSVEQQNKPFFFLLSSGVSASRLKDFEKSLPFIFSKMNNEFLSVQPELLRDAFLAYFSGANTKTEIWNGLPPLTQFAAELSAKAESNVLVGAKVKNILINNPLIVSRSLGKQRAFSILGGDLWRWQLQTAEKYPEFFNNFINDIVKWLNTASYKEQFKITTEKKTYSINEEIKFTAELYDQTFTPIETADISMQVSLNEKKYELVFSPLGNGIYFSSFTPGEAGDYKFEGAAKINGIKIKSGAGRFSVGNIQIEKIDTRMRAAFLNQLAKGTNGEYYSIENYNGLKKKLLELNNASTKENTVKKEIQAWTNEWVLFLIILLFTLEWFIRKKSGMI